MLVRELVEMLQECRQDLPVCLWVFGDSVTIETVRDFGPLKGIRLGCGEGTLERLARDIAEGALADVFD